ncbi:MAG: hypothetical protein EZS28_026285 [Streblomastix strix]|uniref:Uncharacterized protein n=1 Tax=Streblomastix strix TaxID=222440 RepID=A0A5J4V642_9EUKA|nr:MAG: hypothetical protein EZS28_026285 [Streblomastix strix]
MFILNEVSDRDQRTIRFISNGDLQNLIKFERVHQVSFPAKGNQIFQCGQRLQIEVDLKSVPSKVVFFIDGEQQKNYVTGVPDKIRFFAFAQQAGSSFHITRSERLRQSSARIDADSVAWKWGENWKQNGEDEYD